MVEATASYIVHGLRPPRCPASVDVDDPVFFLLKMQSRLTPAQLRRRRTRIIRNARKRWRTARRWERRKRELAAEVWNTLTSPVTFAPGTESPDLPFYNTPDLSPSPAPDPADRQVHVYRAPEEGRDSGSD